MINIKEGLKEILAKKSNSPFLFVGSGFSRRYLETESWEDLLKRFSEGLCDFRYYLTQSDGDLPYCASMIAKDYSEFWWKSPKTREIRERFQGSVTGPSSPLKIDIANYFASITQFQPKDPILAEELKIFQGMNAQGVITTNWDKLIETLLPDYKVFVGQASILSGTPQNIGEIYKIHGCCSLPNSLVLTKEDYDHFDNKMAYLAAKLITIFVEHPIIFIGYSISDKNIAKLLKSIIDGLSQAEIKALQENLIFVQRKGNRPEEKIDEKIIVVNNQPIPITQVVTDNFKDVYEAISELKLKLPARLLRFCREQLYQIVSSNTPTNRLAVVDIEDLDDYNQVEFVVGMGVIKATLSDQGYRGITVEGLFRNIVFDDPKLDPKMVLENTLPNLYHSRRNLPIFKYFSELGIASLQDAAARFPLMAEKIESMPDCLRTGIQYQREYEQRWVGLSTADIIFMNTPEKATILIPFQNPTEANIQEIEVFVKTHFDELWAGSYNSWFRKLICFLDFLKFGPWL